jgi:TetR/AcrR family transcriptional regulator, regulator of biofilm formation and stress response
MASSRDEKSRATGAERTPTPSTAAGHRPRRYDPDRRARIIESCLDVIAEVGVAGASHRRIATAADVPLGSMTYHFAGMEQLLYAAFEYYARATAQAFERDMSEVKTAQEACVRMTERITGGVPAGRDLVVTQELYTLAAREPLFRAITHAWMADSRRVLERFFDQPTARLLDALNEGLILHRALDVDRPDSPPASIADVALGVGRITGTAPR